MPVIESEKYLPWNFEAFREYLSFEVLQQAAAVLRLFEGELFSTSNPKILKMQRLLERRTGKTKWLPQRAGTEEVNWNIEGDVYRNKGRLLTSMFILAPKSSSEPRVRLLEFGRALGAGRVSKREFYRFIVERYQFPHPAYTENWDSWNLAGKRLKPFLFIIHTLFELEKVSPNSYLTIAEIADYLYTSSEQEAVPSIVKDILHSRKEGLPPRLKRSDKIHRKIGDMTGFLCLSGYCLYNRSGHLSLNAHEVHTQELTHYEEKRRGESAFDKIEELLKAI